MVQWRPVLHPVDIERSARLYAYIYIFVSATGSVDLVLVSR